MDNLILKRRAFVAEKIQKSFDNDIEKAAHGVYEDNTENRRLNRVGQEYGHAAKDGESAADKRGKGDEPKSVGDLVKQRATEASTDALKRASKDENAKPEVREAAKKELANRGGDDSVKEKPSKAKKKESTVSSREYVSKKSSENSGANRGDSDLADEVAKRIIDDAKDFYVHNGDYYGYDSLKDYIDSNDWADDVDTDEFEDGMEAMQYVTKSLKKLAKKGDKKYKEAVAQKKQRINMLTEYGADKDDDRFLKENEEHFSDVLKKHGFDSFDEFLDWGMEIDSDDDLDKYDRIYLKCFKSIPAENYLPEDKR